MAVNITKAKKKAEGKMPGGNLLETAVGMVTVSHKDGSKEESSEELMVTGPGPFANIGVRAKVTINLGNYENVQIEVSIFLPSVAKESEINDTFTYATGWIDEKMQELSEKYTPKKP